MNLNETLYNAPRTVTIPDNTYFNETELSIEMIKQSNRVFSAYEKDATDPRVFTGYNLSLIDGSGASVVVDKKFIKLDVYKSVPITTFLAVDSEFTTDANGELTTANEALDFKHEYNRKTVNDPELPNNFLATDTFLSKGGGVAFQYNMRFNLKNLTLTSLVKLVDQNGDYMTLNYNTEQRPDTKPLVYFYVEKK